MPKLARYSLNKLIVLWTVLLLFTPCITKQSLKGFLDIPVTTLYTADQAHKLRSCPEIRQGSEDQVASYTTQKQVKNLRFSHQATIVVTYKEATTAKPLNQPYWRQAYTVPIYILHDQLLI